jgi:hypothetical protein
MTPPRFILAVSTCAVFIALPNLSLGEILVNPAITNSAPPFSGEYLPGNVFDSNKGTDYASQGSGADTFIDFDFGVAQTVDAFALVTRNSPDDFISSYDLIFSNNADFSSPTVITINGDVGGNVGGRTDGPLRLFAPVTARYVRWDVTGVGSSAFFNHGANEIRFLRNTANLINGVSVINSSIPFNANFAASGAVNRNVGPSDFVPGNEFATNAVNGGVNTFIDFDLGAGAPAVSGFDFFQRQVAGDRPLSFDVIFSDDPTFATSIQTRSYSNTQTDWTVSDAFAPINARYVRMDVTAVSGAGNLGLAEGLFYTVPEPSIALHCFAAFGALAGWKRRRVQ